MTKKIKDVTISELHNAHLAYENRNCIGCPFYDNCPIEDIVTDKLLEQEVDL